MPEGVGKLDDADYPALTMGQAAELLGVQPAFLRSLDAAGVLAPHRSPGGHRRYSRRQLALAQRMRELFDDGMTLDAAARIVELQDQLARERQDAQMIIDDLRSRLARVTAALQDPPPQYPPQQGPGGPDTQQPPSAPPSAPSVS